MIFVLGFSHIYKASDFKTLLFTRRLSKENFLFPEWIFFYNQDAADL